MSKNLIPKLPWDEYIVKQRNLDKQVKEWKKTQGDTTLKPQENPDHPRMTNKVVSRWDFCESYSNYDQMRWGPDPIDSVIDRLGVFEDIDFTSDINHAMENSHPTTWVTRTGTAGYDKPGSSHYQVSTVREFERNGLDAHNHQIFDSATMGSWCTKIRDYIGLDEERAHQGALRADGYSLIHVQRPMQCANNHYDTYFNIMKNDPDLQYETHRFRRFAVFLEDWVPGHVWNFGNASFTHWVRGECISWDWMHMPHGTANMCMKPRFSLHLTGYMTESSYKFYKEGTPGTRYRWNEQSNTFDKVHNQLPIIPR